MWCAVSHWLAENQLIRPEKYREAQFVWVVNEWLSSRRSRRENPELVSEIEAALSKPMRSKKKSKAIGAAIET